MGLQKSPAGYFLGTGRRSRSIVSLFRDRYRVESTRKPGWDYAEPGRYFVTICTRHRIPWFGEIRNGIMGLSDIGCVVHDYWGQIPWHFPHVYLDRFIVMPNHIHGIIVIENNSYSVETRDSRVSTIQYIFSHMLRVQCGLMIPRPMPGSIGSIIGQLKSSSTKRIHALGYRDFAWQPLFHDHIIRNEREYYAIRRYININPAMWHRDRNNAR